MGLLWPVGIALSHMLPKHDAYLFITQLLKLLAVPWLITLWVNLQAGQGKAAMAFFFFKCGKCTYCEAVYCEAVYCEAVYYEAVYCEAL